jgi:hypothetical protein
VRNCRFWQTHPLAPTQWSALACRILVCSPNLLTRGLQRLHVSFSYVAPHGGRVHVTQAELKCTVAEDLQLHEEMKPQGPFVKAPPQLPPAVIETGERLETTPAKFQRVLPKNDIPSRSLSALRSCETGRTLRVSSARRVDRGLRRPHADDAAAYEHCQLQRMVLSHALRGGTAAVT